MPAEKPAARRSARRIGVERGANFEERLRIILHEAARAFNENGVHNTSLDDVAARLGVTKPALYHYVPGKEEMIRQCLKVALENNQQLLDEAAAIDGTGLDKLRYVFERWAANATTDFGRAIVLIESNSLGEENRKEYLDAHRFILDCVETLIEQGIADGSVRPGNPAVMALGLMGIFNSPARWFREDGPLTVEEAVNELVALMEQGISSDGIP